MVKLTLKSKFCFLEHFENSKQPNKKTKQQDACFNYTFGNHSAIMYLTTATRSVRLIENSILEIIYFDNVTISAQAVQNDFNLLHQNLPKGKFRKLIVTGKNSSSSLAAKKLQAQLNEQMEENIIGEALIAENSIQRIIASTYIFFNKAKYPKKCFNNIVDAKSWLNMLK